MYRFLFTLRPVGLSAISNWLSVQLFSRLWRIRLPTGDQEGHLYHQCHSMNRGLRKIIKTKGALIGPGPLLDGLHFVILRSTRWM